MIKHKEIIMEMLKAIIIVYVFGVLVAMEPNPAEWWAVGRLAAILFLVKVFSDLREGHV